MIELVSEPIKTITDLSSNTYDSQWNALHNPVYWVLQRKDFNILQISPWVVTAQYVVRLDVQPWNQTLYDNIVVGDTIYLNGTEYDETFVIQTIITALNAVIIESYTGRNDQYGGYSIVAISSYHVKIKMLNPVGGATLGVILKYDSDKQGLIYVDITENLKRTFEHNFGYDQINKADYEGYSYYAVSYLEQWSGNTGGLYYFLGVGFVVNAVKQLLEINGENLGEFVTANVDMDEAFKAKFMTLFTKPTAFEDYPFSLSFIYSEFFDTEILQREFRAYNINGGLEDTATDNLFSVYKQGLNHLMLKDYWSSVDEFEVWLNTAATYEDWYVTVGYMTAGYVDAPSGAGSDIRITEKKRVKADSECVNNPIFLMWLNKYGGWDSWLFKTKQIVNLITREGQLVERSVTDLENDNTKEDILYKESVDQYIVGVDGIDDDDLSGLKGLIDSPKVYILNNRIPYQAGSEDPQWKTIRIIPGTYKIQENDSTTNDLEMALEFPSNYYQRQ